MKIEPINLDLPHLEGLNERQKEAVIQTTGPVLVIAGAGAGKTKTITHRILHLIKNGVEPSSILAITFTNKSAKEMRERVMALLHSDKSLNRPISFSEKPFVSTFHSLGVHILKEQSKILGLPRHFSIFDKTDSKQAVKRALEKFGMDPKQYEPAKILSVISKEKGNMVSLSDFQESSIYGNFGKVVLPIWGEYERILAQEKALDFDDLLLRTANLLKTNEEVRKYYQKVWKYIHIDEYQDTNRAQYLIAKLLCGENRNICAVGDVDQNIYSWRGADLKNLLNFEKDYPETKIVLLEENYRSTQNILNVANKIIAKNRFRHEKNLFTKNDVGEKISLYSAINEQDEAYFVAMKSLELIRAGGKPSEIAVLYRANFQSRVLEEAFLSLSVPYQLLGTKFFERKEVKDVLSYIRAGLNPESLSDIKRIINVPARGIGKITLLKILEGNKENLPPPIKAKSEKFYELLKKIRETSLTKKPSELIRFVIQETGIENSLKNSTEEDAERLENIQELTTLALRYDHLEPEKAVESLLADASLASDQDELEEKKDAVKLMTIHSAKGLEFDNVFVTGLEEDLFPHKKLGERGSKDSDGEEERRLFYVAITRARKKLYLCYAGVRTIFGTTQVNIPSEFLGDIDDEYIEVEPAYPFDERPSGRFKTIYFD